MTFSINEKLSLLRTQMKEQNLDAFVIPTADAHNCEYPSDSNKRRAYISGFTGSAGTAVVTQKEALLWTDGRYFTQAEQELNLDLWIIMKDGISTTPTISTWLKNSEDVHSVGYDPFVTSIQQYKAFHTALNDCKTPKDYIPVSTNLIDEIWEMDGRPAEPESEVFLLEQKFCGETIESKVENIRKEMNKEGADCVVLSRLDDTAWVTNMRGSDIMYCPVFLSYVTITLKDIKLYINEKRMTQSGKDFLKRNGVHIRPYGAIFGDLEAEFEGNSRRLWLDGDSNMKLYHCIDNQKKRLIVKLAPTQIPKAKKNSTEIAGMQEAHIRDAMAEITFLCWLEDMAKNRTEELQKWTEYTVAEKLDGLRKSMPDSRGLSFNTISSIGPNGAVIHYAAQKDTARHLSQDLYLVDSGGQYLQGTTDVTRTLHLGTPTAEQKECYTRVLKGHLQLARQVFPENTKGTHLDVLARQALWNVGLNYAHGTGHGVGSFLNVHEGPHRICQPVARPTEEPSLQIGMIVSNEPGVYLVGKFGVRIENLVFIKKYTQPLHSLNSEPFLCFEDLTLIPHQKQMIEKSLLSEEEICQFNEYHSRVLSVLKPRLEMTTVLPDKEKTIQWLIEATSPL